MIRIRRNAHPRRAPADAGKRGLALLIVLWIIAAAALLVSAFNASVRSGVSFVNSEVQLARTEALLDAGAEIAATRLIDEEKARRWVPDGRRYTVSFAGAELAISIEDANGRIDLNKADEKLLGQFFMRFMGSEESAGRLRDRILLARGQIPGAKNSKPKNELPELSGDETETKPDHALPFVDVGQLRGFKGMTLELYRRMAPFLTVYGRNGGVNPLAARDEVLAAIPGLTQSDIAKLRAALKTSSEDDPVLQDISSRAGAYLVDSSGPAYLVTVALVNSGTRATGRVYVLATGLDGQAPYRLISKRPLTSVQLAGPG